jgi:anti-sigma factor RsiW
VRHQYEEACGQLLAHLSDYVDGTLQAGLCRELEQHLAGCDDCRIVLNTLKKTVELYRLEGPAGMPDAVRERLFKRLSLDDLMEPSDG